MAILLEKTNQLILLAVITVISLYFIYKITRKKEAPEIRRLPGLDAIEEAIGRAAEMGKPVHWWSGSLSELTGEHAMATIAGVNVLGHMTSLAAKVNVQVIASVGGDKAASLIPIVDETMRAAYIIAGKPEAFSLDSVRFWGDTIAVQGGIMGLLARLKPAANVMIGPLPGASTIAISEAGNRAGAISIGGTQRAIAIPELAVSNDYLLIGEEIFAVGAYLTKEPVQVGSIVAQDAGKYLTIALIVIGVALSALGITLKL